MPGSVLVTQGSLHDIAGSEVVTFELAARFAEEGRDVTVVAYSVSEEWRERFERLPGTVVRRFDDPALPEDLARRRPDIAWIHHGVLPEPLLCEPGRTRFVFHHMSSFQLQEFPLSPRVEAALASAIVFPSQNTLDVQLATGLYAGVDAERLSVLGNPAPDAFARERRVAPETLGRLLLVSNHPPEEVEEAVAVLAERGVEVVRFGGDPADPAPKRLVTPEDIQGADAVLTIGKTVQYALVGGVPVFVYDHFGGPGWLTEENVAEARRANFSGRGFPAKEAGTIAAELVDGYAEAAADAETLRERHAADFLLSRALDRVFERMPREPEHAPIDTDELAAALQRGRLLNGLVNAIESRTLAVKDLSTRRDLLRGENAELRDELAQREAELVAKDAVIAQLSRGLSERIAGVVRRTRRQTD